MNLTIVPRLFNNPARELNNKQQPVKEEQKYPNLAPLACDTVSFGVGEKVLINGNRMRKQVGLDINKTLEKPFEIFERTLYEIFGDLIATSKHPDRPILMIKKRIKSPESIAEKGGARDCRNVEELTQKIQDLMGGRLVLRDTSKETLNEIISRLEKAVNRGLFNICEIENYFAEQRLAYVTPRQIEPLVKTAEKKIGTIRVTHEKHPAGYHAVHCTLRMPKTADNSFAELQIMGSDTDLLKEVEDLTYKIACNKPIQKKYRPLMKYLSQLQGEDTVLKNAFREYTKQAYMHQRRRKSIPFGEDTTLPAFLDIPWYLPQNLDFKFLYQEMKKIDAAEAAKQAKITAFEKSQQAITKAPKK